MQDQFYDELLVELECPICTEYMSPPIRQCETGHSVCEKCRKKLAKCALCQGKFTDSRNLSLEGLAIKMRYPCINKSSGCIAQLSYSERETHELRCGLKGYKCAMDKCPWTGQLEDLAGHWASKKMSSKPYGKSNVCHTKLKTESLYVNMVNAHHKLFWFKCKISNNKFYWIVQYIGNAAECENYYYEIEIFKPGKSKRKILLSDYCQSVELENSQLFCDDSLSVNVDTVKSFVSGDQLLLYYMRVLRSDDKEGEQGAAAPVGQTKPAGWKPPRDRSRGPPNNFKKDQKKKFVHNNKPAPKKGDDFVLL